jgi:hypothetical protein
MNVEVGIGMRSVSVGELKSKPQPLGRIMWEIACLNVTECRDHEAYMELLESTAQSIISLLREEANAD